MKGPIDHAQEFVCCECGQHIISFSLHRSEFKLCGTCITLPGWHEDPELRRLLGPNLPPLSNSADAKP